MAEPFRIFQVRTYAATHDRVCEIAERTGKSRNSVVQSLLRMAIADFERSLADDSTEAMASVK
jgi:hypothetical protein